jgi:hypothetical protein
MSQDIDEKKLEALQALLDLCGILALSLQSVCNYVLPLYPIKPEQTPILTDEQIAFLDNLINRYSKLQDTIGAKLFPLLLEFLQQEREHLGLLDLLRRLEEFGFLSNTEEWLEMRKLRNYLVHEYPDDFQDIADNLNKAIEYAQYLITYWSVLKDKVEKVKADWSEEFKKKVTALQNVRLTKLEIEEICTAFRTFFAPQDHLWLFGSRTNPDARGGDIDLYIETTIPDASAAIGKQNAFVFQLYDKIGEQKIDVVLNSLTSPCKLPIYEVAREEGVQLV